MILIEKTRSAGRQTIHNATSSTTNPTTATLHTEKAAPDFLVCEVARVVVVTLEGIFCVHELSARGVLCLPPTAVGSTVLPPVECHSDVAGL